KTSYDADNRPLLVMRSNLWASGYDVDGTDQTSLGQFSGRVQQTYKHSVPRFFVPEHGTMFTLALVRRSEERRVGKEGRYRWSQYHYKINDKRAVDGLLVDGGERRVQSVRLG